MRYSALQQYYDHGAVIDLISIDHSFTDRSEYFELVHLAMNKPEEWVRVFENKQLNSLYQSGIIDLSTRLKF